ncbi:Outer membrane protein assembly factor BamB, contains PQQ-like beta-propeller repeat [Monaibacterium marinum]|uniref:Outer membrane protein assembly factor BamB, contains PQQ-like beta-propeller repeat n=1 Tax=Pontivivens marinum TaxID=1690039 RepID=A0A2C9CTG7_9RHOB|nr:PQQ-like beta-propeller repeat protein [Monaibacterium marinum]SOH94445.1 Outer membrane protein assembly factor BamB, contains PQQ-like beta-propeller repeat [Monaibacterium marinum]
MILRASLIALGALSLTACGLFGEDEERMPGDRIPVRPQVELSTGSGDVTPLPVASVNSAWTHEGGSASHLIPHPALQPTLSRAFAVSVGQGSTEGGRMTSGPVGNSTAIYTLDAEARVTATGPNGQRLWSRSLIADGQPAEEGFGGGVSLGQGTLFATTGFGEIYALDATTGAVQWQQRADAPFRAAPTVAGRRVIAVARNDVATAYDADSGQILWRLSGARGDAGVLAGSQAATNGALIVLPFSSGEMVAAFSRNGRRAWAAAITAGRRGLARSSIGDVTGDPVFGDVDVIAGNQSGSLVSLDARSGRRNWTHPDGAQDAAAIVGQAVFFVTDQAELLRLDRATGAVIWRTQLAERNADDDEIAARYLGPVVAGGRIFVANGHDGIEVFSPEDGSSITRLAVAGGVAGAPAVIDNTLYVLSNTGTLYAYR